MLSFIFVSGPIREEVLNLWLLFFSTCTSASKYEIIAKPESGLPANKTFTFDNTNLRFSSRMVDFMHRGALLARDGSTVVFLSDSSVPLMSCDSVHAMLFRKTTSDISQHACTRSNIEKVIENSWNSWFRENCTCDQTTHIKKGSQWLSLPKQTWLDAYDNINKDLCYLTKYGFDSGAPDEFYVHTQLERADIAKATHYLTWSGLGDGHPEWLQVHGVLTAIKRGYPFARKYKHNEIILAIITQLLHHRM